MHELDAKMILDAPDGGPVLKIQIDEWGGWTYIRTLKSHELDSYEASLIGKNGRATEMANARARFAVRVLGDADGRRIFKDEDASRIGNKSAPALVEVWNKGRKHNRMDEDEIEELAGNSESDAGSEYGSD